MSSYVCAYDEVLVVCLSPMSRMELSELMSVMTAQVVNAQAILDQAYKGELDKFMVLAGAQGPSLRAVLEHLAPERMVIRDFNISLSISVSTERDTEFKIKVFPFNMNYSLRHSLKVENESRLEMCVEQIPVVQGTFS